MQEPGKAPVVPPKTPPLKSVSEAVQGSSKEAKPSVTDQSSAANPQEKIPVAPGKAVQTLEKNAVPAQDALKAPPPALPQPALPTAPAQAPGAPVKQAEPFRVGSILEPALWLVAALLILAGILAWVKRYQQKEALEHRDSPHDQLANFRQALDEGEMSEEEFRKVKARLSEKLRHPEVDESKKPANLGTGAATDGSNE